MVYYTPGKSHVKEMAAVMNKLNKLQMGEWLLEHIESDETSCCYLADGAESQQVQVHVILDVPPFPSFPWGMQLSPPP